MQLEGLLLEAESFPGYRDLLERLESRRRPTALRVAIVDAAKPYLLACLGRDVRQRILVVAGAGQRAMQLVERLHVWSSVGALLYGETDALFYERTLPDASSLGDRLRVLESLTLDRDGAAAPIVVASIRALMNKVMAPHRFVAACRRLSVGDTLDVNSLLSDLLKSGYRPDRVVDEAGVFARRGGIVDVFSPASPRPVRIELFGDEIETIREFDPATQRSISQLDSVFISPARETICDRAVVRARLARLDLSSLRPEVAEQWRRDLEAIWEDGFSERQGYYDVACCDSTLLDYLSQDALVVLDEPSEVKKAFDELDSQAEQLRRELVDMGELPPDFPKPYVSWDELESKAVSRRRLEISWRTATAWPREDVPEQGTGGRERVGQHTESAASTIELPFRGVSAYGGRIKMVSNDIADMLPNAGRVVIVSQQAKRLLEFFEERGIPATIRDGRPDGFPVGRTTIVHGELQGGFELVAPTPEHRFVLLTDAELFGWSKHRRAVPRKAAPRHLFISELEPGTFVVHVEHGVGRFQGLTHLSEDGVDREYMVIEYAEGDRLYVPVDQLDRISRYIGVGDQTPRLNRLGTGDWARLKDRVKAAVRDVARELLEIYAAREIKPGFAFSPDTLWQRELEDSFPYVETPDQIKAIAETKADMERPKPMDRLICGDVGYGKTEVALRAAFKAVMDGKQVAMLVPTTVLAQQHFDTLRERMQAFPVSVEMLSRFRTEKEQQAIIEGLKAGTVDVCIGTHRLIQKDVQFKDLGLVIIDEEQRFGVVHKERLKQLRKEVDVLTLTATPIPRTLYLALSGVRDMSTIDTPPEERLPIKTYVTEYDPRLVREAILRELDRGGQVYFVHNRVQSIGFMAQRLSELVPEALIELGHGQMPEDRLEKVMVDFAAGKFDVLVCTTIIESGIDIPNVNTIIINQADRFGLSQLYQLRGRVGRGASRAYAYFLFSKEKRLSPTAEKRLRTIFEAAELGSGFRIAMRDLEIRGAGNLLGTEQHGHVAAVGFDLYCRLLADAVKELQGKAEEERPDVTVSLPVAAYIPETYVTDESLRINLYQRMASAKSLEEVGNLVLEMRDRFGELPKPALDLAYLLQLKLMAARAEVRRIEAVGDEIVIALGDGVPVPRDELRQEFGSALKVGNTQLRVQRKLSGRGWLGVIEQVVERLARSRVR